MEINKDIQKLFEAQEYETVFGLIPEAPEKKSTMMVFGDGIYLLRDNTIGRFIRKVSSVKLPGVADGPSPSFQIKLPKIGTDILEKQVRFYREVMSKHNDAEAYTIILWDTEAGEYVLVCPDQKISKANVQYVLGPEYLTSRYIQVMSCHSHNSMGAFFSGTDNADEKGDMLYMVMGKLNNLVPEFKIRACSAGEEVCKLGLQDVFSGGDTFWEMLSPGWTAEAPADWMSRLNVTAPYVNIHMMGGALRDGGFRYGTYTPEAGGKTRYEATRWPTQSGKQLTIESILSEIPSLDNDRGEDEGPSIAALIASAKGLIGMVGKGIPAEDALEIFFERIVEAGFADTCYDYFNYEDPPWWSDTPSGNLFEHSDHASEDFQEINSYLERINK